MSNDYLIIRKMEITEASMDSSPVTIGFPAVSAILGFVHALQRKLQARDKGLKFTGAGISCHSFNPFIYRTKHDLKPSMTRNPPYKKKYLSKGAPFIEEGKADMNISLVIELQCGSFVPEELSSHIKSLLPHLRFSGGTIWQPEKITFVSVAWDDDAGQKKVLHQLMPGFVLLERRDLVEETMKNNGVDALDAILDHLEVCQHTAKGEDPEKDEIYWARKSGTPGWLVPVSVGYRAITPFEKIENQRDPNCEHAFAENVLTLGEFVMPIRLDSINDIIWRPSVSEETGLYVYTQKHQTKGD